MVATYAVVTAGQVVVLLFDDLAAECAGCPEDALLIRADDATAAMLDGVVGAIGAGIAVAVVVLDARRWRAASVPLRRALTPVLSVGGAGIASLARLYAS